MKPQTRIFLGLLWLIAVLTGTGALMVYDHTPGPATQPPARWPAQTSLPKSSDKPTIIMFAHPRCPCTRAALTELADILTQYPGQANTSVSFMVPENPTSQWTSTDLWDQAKAIDAVTARADPDGRQAAIFHASTSGHVLVYSAQGHLLFSGAITPSRAHTGPSPGKSALLAILSHATVPTAQAPVFGCSLISRNNTSPTREDACCP